MQGNPGNPITTRYDVTEEKKECTIRCPIFAFFCAVEGNVYLSSIKIFLEMINYAIVCLISGFLRRFPRNHHLIEI